MSSRKYVSSSISEKSDQESEKAPELELSVLPERGTSGYKEALEARFDLWAATYRGGRLETRRPPEAKAELVAGASTTTFTDAAATAKQVCKSSRLIDSPQ